jgi:DNA-binding response OmpR family regulator
MPRSADDTNLAQEAVAPAPPTAAAPTILIVDDDPVVRSLMLDSLEDEGFSVIEAEDGVQACGVCDHTVPALLIVDAMMPNMDGFELCRRWRAGMTTQYVPILMATGLDDNGSIVRAYESGATDFVAKPLNWPILNHRIHYMLRGAHTLEDLERAVAGRDEQRKFALDHLGRRVRNHQICGRPD